MGSNFCPNCGATLVGRTDSNYCPTCGMRMAPNAFDVTSNTYPRNFTLISAYTNMFKRYADFKGRSRRSEYWLASIASTLVLFGIYALAIVCMVIGEGGGQFWYGMGAFFLFAYFIYALAIIVPSWALTVRRLHDTGKSGWWMLINFIPLVGGLILFVFTVTDSTPGPNQYGNNPKETIIL